LYAFFGGKKKGFGSQKKEKGGQQPGKTNSNGKGNEKSKQKKREKWGPTKKIVGVSPATPQPSPKNQPNQKKEKRHPKGEKTRKYNPPNVPTNKPPPIKEKEWGTNPAKESKTKKKGGHK